MRKIIALAFALGALPFVANAQMAPEGGGPPPEVRAQFEQARTQARTNSMNALSADHRAKVQSIAQQVDNGSLSRQDASKQIDALLTPQESQAVLAQGQKMHDAMRAAFQSQNGGGYQGAHNAPGGGGRRTPDAGRLLLMLNTQPPSPPPGP